MAVLKDLMKRAPNKTGEETENDIFIVKTPTQIVAQ
jgi:hypothetical protein